ncbi:MAG: 1-acyl-sn-glycerol-3-phosphate acyltransferase [Hyphomicrobiales bacterium]|nr:MAG: 1-acyl-sn-glycerol-3-phosphate acyltransferase [Hyphomicrobiales bacterium]
MLRVLALVVFTFVILLPHLICMRWFPKAANQLAHRWQKMAAWTIGIKIHISGTPKAGPVLYLSNHTSWLDIVALSNTAPLSFVAKSEVSSWPVFASLAKWQRTIFVERDRRSRTGVALGQMVQRLEDHDALVLFPEGTSSDGWNLLPFKSALIGAVVETATRMEAHDVDLYVQPVAVAYTKLHGIALGRMEADYAAWIGDIDLIPHLWRILKTGGLEAQIHFGEPVEINPDTNRKILALDMEQQVRQLMEETRR